MTYFAVGWGKIYHRDELGNWTDHTPAGITTNHRIQSVYAVLQNEAYAVGYLYYAQDPIFYKWDDSTWTTWNVTPYPNIGNTGRYWRAYNISGASRDEIYIIFTSISFSHLKVWKGDYSGNGAYIFESDNQKSYSSYCAGPDELYVALSGSPYLKKWNGSTWSDSTISSGQLNHINGASGNIYTTYGHGGTTFNIYRGTWDTWNTDSSPADFYMQTYQEESDIWAYGNKCWIAGWKYTSSMPPAVAYYDGISWSTIQLSSKIDINFYSGIVGKDDSHILAVYNKGYAYFYDGNSWTEEEIGATFDIQDADYGPEPPIDTSLATRNITPDYDYQYQTITDYEVAQDDPLSVRTMNDLCHNINHLKAHMMPKLISHMGTADDKLTSKLGVTSAYLIMPFAPRKLMSGHDLLSIHCCHQRVSGSGTTAWIFYVFHKYWVPTNGRVDYFSDIWLLRACDIISWETDSDSPTMSYRQIIVTASEAGKYVEVYPMLVARNSDNTTTSSIISLDVSCSVQGAKI